MLGLLFRRDPRCRLPHCRGVWLTFAFRDARLPLFLVVVLKRFQPQHFTILVALVQRFKLIDEGHGAVAFESFVPVGRNRIFENGTLHQFSKKLWKEKLMVCGNICIPTSGKNGPMADTLLVEKANPMELSNGEEYVK